MEPPFVIFGAVARATAIHRIGADVLRQQITLARGFDERAAQVGLIGEGDAVDHGVEALFGGQSLGELGQVFIARHVAFEDAGRAERGAQFFHGLLQALALIGEQQPRPFALKRLRDGVGQAPAVGDAQNQRGFSFQ